MRRPALAITGAALWLSLSLGLAGVLWQWQRASDNALFARRSEYAADMHLAQLALAEGNGAYAGSLLQQHRPGKKAQSGRQKAETDFRGWEWRYLWQLCQGDERFLAVAYSDGAIHVFHHPSGELKATFTGHGGPVDSVHFVENGRTLVSTSTDGSARLWDLVGRREPAVLKGHFALIVGGAISPDGRRLGTGGLGAGDAVKLWDLAAHRAIMTLAAEGQYFFHLGFSPEMATL